MEAYQQLVRHVLNQGIRKTDRTNTGTLSCFGYQMRFDLCKGFPLVTTKKTHFKSVVHELLWFLKGSTNVDYLNKNGVRIWNEWADGQGELGPIYGKQWRSWGTSDGKAVDQIKNCIDLLQTVPDSRRNVVSAWNVGELGEMALMPCHTLFQFYVAEGKLSCHLYQRSGDVFLGVPFNIASYALLTMMVAQVAGLKPGEFIHSFGDVHLYTNHLEQAQTLLGRKPYPLPCVSFNKAIRSIFDFSFEDICLDNYVFHPAIKATVAV
ncbi:unnamed protein product [Rotaria socialis]|uniref:Thymidylate synthase n=1 Tax=Rotaria socialis TaxID=392032 RepID=A0A817WMS5_9BILA|nr:unnamed protein product [Rotaria socialis]CAF4646261.1 unnamed protein product [Rotaria socialis]